MARWLILIATLSLALIGAASALLTLASGILYGAAGPQGFWVRAALCAIARLTCCEGRDRR